MRRDRLPTSLIVGSLALVFLALQILPVLPSRSPALADFRYYYDAAVAIRGGQSPFVVPHHIYPALLSFLVSPLAAFPYEEARQIWFALGVAAALFGAFWTWKSLSGGIASSRAVAIAVSVVWASSWAVGVSLREGQVNALLLQLLVLSFWPPKRRRWIGPAALGMAIAIKLWPGALLFSAFLRRRWRSLVTTAAWVVAGVVVPLVVVAVALDGPRLPPRTSYWQGTPAFLNSGLPATLLRALDPPPGCEWFAAA